MKKLSMMLFCINAMNGIRKNAQFSLLVLVLAGLLACDMESFEVRGPEDSVYNFSFLIEDSLGNDMGREISLSEWAPKKKPVEEATSGVVDRSQYEFFLMVDPVYSTTTNQCMFTMTESAGIWYMNTSSTLKGMREGRQHSTRYMMKFPKLFGDTDVHVIDAYWTIPSEILVTAHFAVCDSLLIDGKPVEVNYTDYPNGKKGEKTNLIKLILP